MGFMDKAKKLAEQAQQKLDEAQEQFNKGQSPDGQQSSGGTRYDQHGRPIEGTPAGEAAPPSAEPVDAGPASGAPAPAAEEAPAPQADSGDSNANPDPFKPLQ
jgi:hypothetical protein